MATIEAKNGYRVFKGTNKITGEPIRVLKDGDEIIMIAQPLTVKEHNDMIEGNEMYVVFETFKTVHGGTYIYSHDMEIDVDYLVRL